MTTVFKFEVDKKVCKKKGKKERCPFFITDCVGNWCSLFRKKGNDTKWVISRYPKRLPECRACDEAKLFTWIYDVKPTWESKTIKTTMKGKVKNDSHTKQKSA